MSVFKAYDIRGVYGKELNDKLITKIGTAFSKFFDEYDTIGIGMDCRIHSEKVKESLIKGITVEKNVLDFGFLTTPAAHYLSMVYQIPILMITASHNPPEYNGIKPVKPPAEDLKYEEIKTIEKMVNEVKIGNRLEGMVEKEESGFEVYKKFLKKRFKKISGYKIGFDAGNSVGSLLIDVIEDLGNEVFVINEKLDGTFPNHLPDPSKPENLQQLKRLVEEKNLDVGFGLDGDCDRVGILTKNNVFTSDKVVLSFAKEGRKFVVEVSLPIYLEKVSREKNFEVIRSRTGRTFAKKVAKEKEAFMFGEYSGHFGFKEFSYIDDGIYTFLRLLKEFKIRNLWFDDIERLSPKYEYVRKDLKTDVSFINRLKKFAVENNFEIREIDGVEVFFDYGRILARPSNTEPVIRLVIECYEENKIKYLEDIVNSLLT